MNRHQRRAAKPQGRNVSKLDRVVAIHEAGHAVARILTAHDLGFSPDQAITYIEVGSRENLGVSVDGRAILISQAVTIGPTLSANIQSVFNRITAGKAASELVGKYI
jgi:hypothetical protein